MTRSRASTSISKRVRLSKPRIGGVGCSDGTGSTSRQCISASAPSAAYVLRATCAESVCHRIARFLEFRTSQPQKSISHRRKVRAESCMRYAHSTHRRAMRFLNEQYRTRGCWSLEVVEPKASGSGVCSRTPLGSTRQVVAQRGRWPSTQQPVAAPQLREEATPQATSIDQTLRHQEMRRT
jgi:hypothetical protein